ncbi:hypothetical protein BIW11_05790 [Tropilaelaps mercedesae]|uniref:Uncharacterized protein n=1 Tax=Tropilaelaps mercedesae TaxID=418985 RepID=A0A1V9Y0Y1_9ACAR|nr:hypothetical protein BIW11_05790 [Tropilaelaps mercedesae]
MLYAIVGIPLMLLYLTNIGDILAKAFRCFDWMWVHDNKIVYSKTSTVIINTLLFLLLPGVDLVTKILTSYELT